jgi:nucleolar protein 56
VDASRTEKDETRRSDTIPAHKFLNPITPVSPMHLAGQMHDGKLTPHSDDAMQTLMRRAIARDFPRVEPELLRTLRTMDLTALREANLILTRTQLREQVAPDQFIMNTIGTIEEIDKVANALAKRLREWYSLFDPELEHAYNDHTAFVDAVLTRTSDRTADTMGGTLAAQDIEEIMRQATMVRDLYARRTAILEYTESVMRQHTPNLLAVAGGMIGAKLIQLAGGMERLSRLPASTIQLLGAETALFRHLRNRHARPPKHGIIFNHVLLQRAPRQARGRMARTIADKISIAAKVDYFHGEFCGDTLTKQIEQKLAEQR